MLYTKPVDHFNKLDIYICIKITFAELIIWARYNLMSNIVCTFGSLISLSFAARNLIISRNVLWQLNTLSAILRLPRMDTI